MLGSLKKVRRVQARMVQASGLSRGAPGPVKSMAAVTMFLRRRSMVVTTVADQRWRAVCSWWPRGPARTVGRRPEWLSR